MRKVKAYVLEAIQNQSLGRTVKPDRNKPLVIPAELKAALAKKPRARKAFEALTKGRQREYAEHVATAKRAETKASRIAKMLPMISAGIGLDDRHRYR
ncbi:MAG: hypothetical protein ACI8QZ_000707 [Chlamydiales bacterium]